MQSGAMKLLLKSSLWIYLLILLAPLLALYLLQGSAGEFDHSLYILARNNTILLEIGVLIVTSLLGGFFSYLYCFYKYPFKKTLHALLLLPLAFPAYVIAFIYLGMLGPSSSFSLIGLPEIQGELWFLILVLSLALTPYVYFFSSIGLSYVSQSEVETEVILGGGVWSFFRYNTLPKLLPFLISAQILVIFESLSDFGAASVINVPVMTTMIYKLWFDLFSFSGAVHLSLRYSGMILLVLVCELLFKNSTQQKQMANRDPVRGTLIPPALRVLGLLLMGLYIIFAFIIPVFQIVLWNFMGGSWPHFIETLESTLKTIALGGAVGILVVLFSWMLLLLLRTKNESSKLWMIFSTIGYSVPGSILAVSAYAILLWFYSSLGSFLLILGLIIALSYKFLTVGMRPIGDAVDCLPQELIETSNILKVSFFKRIKIFFYPYLRESCVVALLLVIIEVMKEMPLTLMLAPSGFQTLSIKIFNYTSEGEWEKAALPSLMLVVVGIISVLMLNIKRSRQ